MTRQQLPPQIKKMTITDRKTGKPVVRYQVTVDAGQNHQTGKRQQVRRRYTTEKLARDALAEIAQQASTAAFVPRKAVTVNELCDDWLASRHNARQTTINGYAYCLAPLREQHGHLAAQKLLRLDLDKLLIALRDGGTKTAKGQTRRAWSPRSLNAAIDAWRLVLAYGCDRRDLAHNVAASMKKVPRPRREMQTYTPDEIRRVLCTGGKDRNGHLWVSGPERSASWRDRRSEVVRHRLRRQHHHHRTQPCPGGRGHRRGDRAEDAVVPPHAAAR